MIEILQFYTSGLWIWAGLTIPLAMVVSIFAIIFEGQRR